MSSYRSKGKGKAASQTSYPSAWSEWERREEEKCYRRYRLVAPGEYDIEYEYDDKRAVQSQGPSVTPNTANESSASQYDKPAYGNYTATSLETITQGVASTTLGERTMGSHITTADPGTNEETFDPNYRVHSEKEFKFGKVFKLLWTEPAGNSIGSQRTEGTESMRVGRHQEKHYEKVRRFVVISAKRGHCLCLPINTYSNQGTNKRGVHADDHAIIYTDKPTRFEGELEKGLSKSPIRVVPVSGRHKLDKASRLNYAKVYTIEYNVKVWFIGKIHSTSEDKIVADYNATHPPLTTAGSYGTGSSNSTYAHATGGDPNPYFPAAVGTNASSYSQAKPYSTQAGGSYSQSGVAVTSTYNQIQPTAPYTQRQGYGTYGHGGSIRSYDQGQNAAYTQGQHSGGYDQTVRRVNPYQPAEPRSLPPQYPSQSASTTSSSTPSTYYPTTGSVSGPAAYPNPEEPQSEYGGRGYSSGDASSSDYYGTNYYSRP